MIFPRHASNFLDMEHRYLSTLSSPQSFLTLSMVAGGSRMNMSDTSSPTSAPRQSLRAAITALRIADCTDPESNSGGSPDAAKFNKT